jgi:hypothetical protein
MPGVSVRITTPPVHERSKEYAVTVDGRISTQRADASGRLTFTLSGAIHEVGIGDGPNLTIAAATLSKLTVLNKGTAVAKGRTLALSAPDALVSVQPPAVPDLAPGERVEIPLKVSVHDDAREILALRAPEAHVFIPVFRDAPELTDYVIHDVGQGRVAIALKDGKRLELFTEDECVDNTARVTVIRHEMSALMEHYSLPRMSAGCRPSFFARWLELRPPEHILHEAWIRMAGRPERPPQAESLPHRAAPDPLVRLRRPTMR